MLGDHGKNTDEAEQQAKNSSIPGHVVDVNQKTNTNIYECCLIFTSCFQTEKRKLDIRSAAAAVLVAAAAAASEAVSAVVTAAAGHTRPGPGQRRGACDSSISPLNKATC